MEALLRGFPSGPRRRSATRPLARNLKLTIEYDGTNYCGWQIQRFKKLKPSIQETLEKALQKILQKKVKIIGSGRTDAGVHALAQVANFKTNSQISLDRLQKGLNALLPDDIVIRKIEEVDSRFHSRFGVRSKVYSYTILNSDCRTAILKGYVYFYPNPLDIHLMRKEAQCLLGKHNFQSFCARGTNIKDMVRTIKRIRIKKTTSLLFTVRCSLITVDIEADGFLYNMVRNIVGTLLEIGRGKFHSGQLKKILYSHNRKFAGPTVPAKGLCLIKVNY